MRALIFSVSAKVKTVLVAPSGKALDIIVAPALGTRCILAFTRLRACSDTYRNALSGAKAIPLPAVSRPHTWRTSSDLACGLGFVGRRAAPASARGGGHPPLPPVARVASARGGGHPPLPPVARVASLLCALRKARVAFQPCAAVASPLRSFGAFARGRRLAVLAAAAPLCPFARHPAVPPSRRLFRAPAPARGAFSRSSASPPPASFLWLRPPRKNALRA